MSEPVADKLTNEKIQQLLAVVGLESAEDTRQNVEAFEHDWCRPRYFSREQLNEIKYFAENIAAAATAKFSQFYQSDFEVTTDSTSQHFANEFLHKTSDTEHSDYYLVLGTRPGRPHQTQSNATEDLQPCGLVGIPHETAIAWATQSLGDTKSEKDPATALSQLEISLLLDTASLFAEAVSDAYDNQDFYPVGSLVAGQFPLDLENTKELCKITFTTKKTGSQDSTKAYLLMLCNKLEPVTKIITQTSETLSAEDISKAITGHLQQMKTSVTVQLGSAVLTFEELMSLSVGDILMLDKRVDEPIKLIVEGIEILQGLPAKSTGKYAVAITRTSFDNTKVKQRA